MQNELLTVVCVKWGPWCAPHGAEYVNRLVKGVEQHLSAPYRFVCFTDDPSGLDPGIETQPLPENLEGSWWNGPYVNRDLRHFKPFFALPYLFIRGRDKRKLIQDDIQKSWQPINLHGWWNKLYLFKKGVLSGRVIFFDLDTVIVGNLDPLTKYDGDFAILQDFNRPESRGSGVMLWNSENSEDIWSKYVESGCPNLRRGDQIWIQRVRPEADLLQDLFPGMFVSFKEHCRDALPAGSSVVCYHGSPRPHEVDNDWMHKHWYRS